MLAFMEIPVYTVVAILLDILSVIVLARVIYIKKFEIATSREIAYLLVFTFVLLGASALYSVISLIAAASAILSAISIILLFTEFVRPNPRRRRLLRINLKQS